MRKLSVFLALLSMISFLSCSEIDKLVIDYPNGGETITQGETVTIKWHTVCNPDPDSDIETIQESVDVYLLSLEPRVFTVSHSLFWGVPAKSDQILWVVPNDLPPGAYKLKIQLTNTSRKIDESDGAWYIVERHAPAESPEN